jgi:hypothetical protein
VSADLQVPSGRAAFEHGATWNAWSAARRRVRWRFALWSGVCLGGLVAGSVVTSFGVPTRGGGLGGAIGGISLLSYVCVLYACLGALRRLRKARRVMEEHPWQSVPAVRRLSGTPEAKGVPVQFRFVPEAEGGEWSPTFVARNPLRWNRWDDAMSQGAWLAGGEGPTAVLALPGGHGLMTLQLRTRAGAPAVLPSGAAGASKEIA